jgi:hypothetical protein
MTEKELRTLIREEIMLMQEEKTPDEKRLGDARLSIISLSQAADMLHRVGVRNKEAEQMALQLDEMVNKLRNEIIPSLEASLKGSIGSNIVSGLGKVASRVTSTFR